MGKFGNDEEVEFEGVVVGTSPKAVRFQADDWDEPEWLPKSQCTVIPDTTSDITGKATVMIKKWLAKKNGWIDG